MILGECGIFAAMFAAGMAASVLAVFLDVMGRAGKAAGAVTDVMIAAEMGAIYFLTQYYAAGGVFRLYSMAAFLLGVYLSRRLCGRFSPTFRRMAVKVLLPLVSAYDRAAKRWEERLRPYKEKIVARREARDSVRREKKRARLALRREKKGRKEPVYMAKKRVRKRSARIVVER